MRSRNYRELKVQWRSSRGRFTEMNIWGVGRGEGRGGIYGDKIHDFFL